MSGFAALPEDTPTAPGPGPADLPRLPLLPPSVAELEALAAHRAGADVAFPDLLRAHVHHVALAHGVDPAGPLVRDLVATVARLTMRETAGRTLTWAAAEVAAGVGVAYPATLHALAGRAREEIR